MQLGEPIVGACVFVLGWAPAQPTLCGLRFVATVFVSAGERAKTVELKAVVSAEFQNNYTIRKMPSTSRLYKSKKIVVWKMVVQGQAALEQDFVIWPCPKWLVAKSVNSHCISIGVLPSCGLLG